MAMNLENLENLEILAALERVSTLEKQMEELVKVVSKKEKKEKKPVDPNKPKKTSGYLIYSNSVRAEVKQQLIADGGEGKPKEVVKAIAAMWKELTDEEKAVWNEKAKTPPASEDKDA